MSFEETLGNGKEGCGLTKNGSASFGERREVATSSESARDKKGEHADQNHRTWHKGDGRERQSKLTLSRNRS
jgi:hypothetical protein